MLRANFQTTGRFQVTVDLNLSNTITAVFGASGAGKSTFLRAIAGLEPAQGLIRFNDREWLDSSQKINMPTHQREIGYVRQNARLFPHLNVRGNLEFPLRHAKRQTRNIEFDRVLDDFELRGFLDRRAMDLSGGETQRVTLARALLAQPQLLLLDEPLTGLDMGRKAEILPYLESLHSQYDIPTLYVSHAIDEVTALCSETIVFSDGKVRASGETAAVLDRPDLDELTREAEAVSLIHAKIVAHDKTYELTTMQVEDSVWSVPMHVALRPGDQTMLRIRARDVALAKVKPEQISVRNVLKTTIEEINAASSGPTVDCLLRNGETRLRARITRASLDQLELKAGDSVFALVKSVTLD